MRIPTSLVEPTIVPAGDVDRGLLRAAGLELERVVMLEPAERGVMVRKLSMDEKADYSQRTDEPAFLGSDEEQEAFFANLAARSRRS